MTDKEKQKNLLNEYQLRSMAQKEEDNKRAVIRAKSVKYTGGKRTLYIYNTGRAKARNLKVDMLDYRTINNSVMQGKMIDIKRDIFMYGSDKVFKAFNTWLLSTTSSNDKAQFAAFLDFVLEMRKDLCNGNTNLNKHDILLNLTQSEEEARKLSEEDTLVKRTDVK